MAKENVLSRMLEVGLTSEEIRKLLKTTSFPTSGTLDVRAANLRDALLTAEIPIRRVLQKAVLPDEMCKVARLSSGGSERVLRGRLAEWFEATFEHQAAGDDADEDDGDATEDDDDGQGLTDDATVSFVQRNDLEAEVAKATSLSRSRVARELAEANGNTLLRNVFRDEWPTNFTVARVQREELYSRVAVATGMTVSEVRVGLVDAYGNSHVRTVLFPEDGGGQDETDDDDEDEDLSDSHEGDDGSSDHHARERSTQASEGRTNDDVLEDIRNLDDAELRDFWFEIGGEGPDPGPCYDYQTHGISRVEAGEGASPPVSGILHYPTGAGKTRVGMELIARALHRDPHHRFVWVTDRKLLIRQTMTRMAELARLFPAKTSFTWAADADEIKAGEDGANVVFMTRATLTQVLKQAGDGRTMHAWKEMLAAGVPMTLIYDECHQLGADKLQENWRRFHESVVTPVNARWRTIGLSATPVPTSAESHRLLRKYIFPQRPKDAPSTCHDYPFHFFHRVRNETLIASGVLCPINLVLDREGGFDFPAALLKEVIGVLRPPGPNASRLDVQDYALKFNKGVLSDSRIIEWLADRLGRSIATLGKTIVFVPTIAAANRLVALLHQRFPMIRGLVAAVHSRMAEIAVPGQEGVSPIAA